MEWEEKGIRGAGSVVRKAYSFGRHSRQPFGRGLAPLRPLPHLSTLSLREALTAPVTLSLHRLALRTPTGAAPGALLRVCSRRLKHDPDSRLCHRVSVMRPAYHGDGPHVVALRGTPTKQHLGHRRYRYPRGSQRAKHPLRYPTSHALYASTLIAPPVDVKRTHVFEGISSKTQAHGSSKQSDQTMAQPEVAPNVTTGITQVMLIRKVVGPLVVHPLKTQRVHHPYKFMCPDKQCWHKTWSKTVCIPRSSRRHNIRTHLAMRLIDRSKERLHWMKINGTKPFFIASKMPHKGRSRVSLPETPGFYSESKMIPVMISSG